MRPLFAIFALLFAATASAQLVETPISTPFLTSPPRYRGPAVTGSDGNDFLAVWADTRVGGTRFTRITHDGTVLDAIGRTFGLSAFSAAQPLGVFWTGSAYQVILRSPGVTVALIDRDGNVIDGPRLISSDYAWAAASSGARTLVVAGTTILVLDDRGNVIESHPSPIVGAFGWTAAWNGSEFAAIATSYDGARNWVSAVLIDANGRTQQTIAVHAATSTMSVIPTPAGFRIFFDDFSGITAFSIVNDTLGDITPLGNSTSGSLPSGTGTLIVTSPGTSTTLSVSRFDGRTNALPPSFTTPATPGVRASAPSLASNGSATLFVWTESQEVQDLRQSLHGAILDASGSARSALFEVTKSAVEQSFPAIATGGENDIATWAEPAGIHFTIHFTRVTRDGRPLDGRGIQVSGTNALPISRVAFDGNAYVVVWNEDNLVFQWIDGATGTLLGSPVRLPDCRSMVDVARDDAGLVFFGTDCTTGRVFLQRIGMAGTIGPRAFLSTPGTLAANISAAYNGREWLVSWTRYQSRPSPVSFPQYSSNVFATRVLPSFTPVDAQPVEIAQSPTDVIASKVATDGRDFVVVWATHDANAGPGIDARTITASGLVTPVTRIAPGDSGSAVHSVVFDGARYAVAYAASHDGSYSLSDVFLTHIGLWDRLVIAPAVPPDQAAALAVRPGAAVRTVYPRIAEGPEYGGVSRVFVRDLSTDARRRIARH